MGRLFWKIFAFIWLTQLAGMLAIAGTFWFSRSRSEEPRLIEQGPMAESRAAAAASLLQYAGTAAFRSWSETDDGPPVYAVDAENHDVLARRLDIDRVTEARNSAASRHVTTADGRQYLVFVARLGPPRVASGGPRPPRRFMFFPGMPLEPTIATLLASLLTAALLAWYFAKPIRVMRNAFEGVAAGDLELRVAPMLGGRKDDLADLGRDFDRMVARLKTTVQALRHLLHDVSHEMRSPLARLQAASGLLRQKSPESDPAVARIETEIARMDGLISELLKLSRLEVGELVEPQQEVDMLELVGAIVDDANFESQGKGPKVVWPDRQAVTLSGMPGLLHGAIENIIRNALKYAGASAQIAIITHVDSSRSHYLLRVVDRGPGVSETDLAELFTPFFRAGNPRRQDGYGLGLAIARRSVEAHGGSIRAQNRPEGGLLVEMILPLSAPRPRAG